MQLGPTWLIDGSAACMLLSGTPSWTAPSAKCICVSQSVLPCPSPSTTSDRPEAGAANSRLTVHNRSNHSCLTSRGAWVASVKVVMPPPFIWQVMAPLLSVKGT